MAILRPSLTPNDAAELARRLAAAIRSGLPLPQVLRGMAQESKPRVARPQTAIADDLERGDALPDVIARHASELPPALAMLLAAGGDSPQLGTLLDQYVHQMQVETTLRRAVWQTLAYPTLVVIATAVLFGLAVFGMLPTLKSVLGKPIGDISSPAITLMWVGEHQALVLSVVAVLVGLLIVGLLVARRRRQLAIIPIVGPLWRLSAVVVWCERLATLLRSGVTLPVAARLAGDSVDDRALNQASAQSAAAVESGRRLSQCLSDGPFPATLVPILAGAEAAGDLPAGLTAAAELYRARLDARVVWIRVCLPPIAFLGVLIVIGWLLGSVFDLVVPLIRRLTMLS